MTFAVTSRFFPVALLVFVPVALHTQPLTSPTTFRIGAQMVLVPVTVTDPNGKTIGNLLPKNFTILDDQKPQQIASFAIEDAPCSVGLVLDTSGSMQNALSAAKDVTHTFLQTANPDDEFLMLTVSTQPGAISEFTTDTTALEKSIELTRPAGLTALIDTVYLGLSQMRRAKQPRRALLILSDGMDNHSRYSKSELLRVAIEADVQVYAIIIDNGSAGTSNTIPFRPAMTRKPWDRPQEAQGPALLEELSDKTGGLHFHIKTDAEAKQAVIKVSQAIRNEYVIGYQPPESQSAGKWHRVRVKSDVPKVNVHARNGYYSQ